MHGFNIQDELRVKVSSFSYRKGCRKEEEIRFFFMSAIGEEVVGIREN